MRRESSPLEASRWAALMERLGIGPNLDTFEKLRAAYTEGHRHYHTAEHINQCLSELDIIRHLAREPDEIELALWFHDAVYLTRRKDNETRSAKWASEFLSADAVDGERVQRVHDLVLATRHDAPTADTDSKLLVDIDLAILGADPATYDRFEENVRKEYWWVPAPLFRGSRATILKSFLDRPAVYATAHFHERFEDAARRNLAAAIAALKRAS
jgi:predicted metal-dependent HD superfamily phosphohydrolase